MRQLAALTLALCACGGPAARSLVSATEDDGGTVEPADGGQGRAAAERPLARRLSGVPGGQSLEPRHLGRADGPSLGRLPGVHGGRLAPTASRLRRAVW